MPKRRPVELSDYAKSRLKDLDRAKTTGKGAARAAADKTIGRKASNRTALNAAKKAFNRAQSSN